MTIEADLHKIRRHINPRRQPRHTSSLAQLDSELQQMAIGHPYRLEKWQRDRLMGLNSFAMGGAGLTAEHSTGEFIYRLSGVKKLAHYVEQWIPDSKYEADRDLFRYIKDDYERARDWLNLSRYARGSFRSPRRFSWWTSLELRPDDPVELVLNANLLGMPRDWLTKYSVVLRCRIHQLDKSAVARIPTTLDGFDSCVFHPTRDMDGPRMGTTIDLNHSRRLRSGTDELVLKSIGVGHIDLRPVQIEDETRVTHGIDNNEKLWNLLRVYYKRLGRSRLFDWLSGPSW